MTIVLSAKFGQKTDSNTQMRVLSTVTITDLHSYKVTNFRNCTRKDEGEGVVLRHRRSRVSLGGHGEAASDLYLYKGAHFSAWVCLSVCPF